MTFMLTHAGVIKNHNLGSMTLIDGHVSNFWLYRYVTRTNVPLSLGLGSKNETFVRVT